MLDILTDDPLWFPWSSQQLASLAETRVLRINPIIYSEISIAFDRIEDLHEILPSELSWTPLTREAAFLAGKAFLQYRRRGGLRSSTLPDFFIGAHAAVEGMTLLTRDVARYQTYFPALELIHP